MSHDGPRHSVIVIGSGFGGTMTALAIAAAFQGKDKSVLMLERGTWWTTPLATVQDRDVETYDFLKKKDQPVQYWASAEDFNGLIDLITRCLRRKKNEAGLYEMVVFGRRGLFGLRKNDGVSILRACGVGGGSLVYSNITIQPPDLIFESTLHRTNQMGQAESRPVLRTCPRRDRLRRAVRTGKSRRRGQSAGRCPARRRRQHRSQQDPGPLHLAARAALARSQLCAWSETTRSRPVPRPGAAGRPSHRSRPHLPGPDEQAYL